ncbi:hypothetical protein VTK26DRAFT_9115 [Humicola hyalothermophila]
MQPGVKPGAEAAAARRAPCNKIPPTQAPGRRGSFDAAKEFTQFVRVSVFFAETNRCCIRENGQPRRSNLSIYFNFLRPSVHIRTSMTRTSADEDSASNRLQYLLAWTIAKSIVWKGQALRQMEHSKLRTCHLEHRGREDRRDRCFRQPVDII